MPEAEASPGKDFSHSRLSMLADCPRRYGYRYVERLQEAFRTIEAFMGTLVHDALGWLYMEREQRRSPTADDLVARFRSDWEGKLRPDVRVIRRDRAPDDYLREGAEMLQRHHATAFSEDRLETVAVEPKVSVDLRGRRYVGYVDRLARRPGDGRLRVVDFKTGSRMPESAAEAGLQARGYALAVLEEHGGFAIDVEYLYLRHGRSIEETLSRADTHAVAEDLGRLIDQALEAERRGEFPARPSNLCAWCGYRESCDASGYAAAPDGGPAACPRCGGALRRRSGRNGTFMGCSRYPDCRFTRDAVPGEA